MMTSDVGACVWFQFGSVIALATKNNKPSRRMGGHKTGLDPWPHYMHVKCLSKRRKGSVQWHEKMRSIETGLRTMGCGYGQRTTVFGVRIAGYGLWAIWLMGQIRFSGLRMRWRCDDSLDFGQRSQFEIQRSEDRADWNRWPCPSSITLKEISPLKSNARTKRRCLLDI